MGSFNTSVSGGISQAPALCCNHPTGILEGNLASSQSVLEGDVKVHVLTSTAERQKCTTGRLG